MLDPLDQRQDLGRVPHPALAESLEVFEQRTLAALELVLSDLLDRPHQVAERAHERERSGVQRLDLGQQTLEQRPQLGTVGLWLCELVGELGERVADRRQACGVEPADLLAERVEPGEELLGQPPGGRDVVGVPVAPPLGCCRGEAGIVVAFDRAPLVERREALFEQVEVDTQRVALAETVRDLCAGRRRRPND